MKNFSVSDSRESQNVADLLHHQICWRLTQQTNPELSFEEYLRISTALTSQLYIQLDSLINVQLDYHLHWADLYKL